MVSAYIAKFFLYKYINFRIKIEGANNEKIYKPFDCIFTGVGGSCLELL
jgi:hypothetical protein